MRNISIAIILGLCVSFVACSSFSENIEESIVADNQIKIGNTTLYGEALVTKSNDTDEWFMSLLKDGLTVQYGLKRNQPTVISQLKYENNEYSLLEMTQQGELVQPPKAAVWLGNGAHYFQGNYIPEFLTGDFNFKDQVNANIYDALTKYIAMPSSATNATISKITLTFKHRLARVKVYVLIHDDVYLDYTAEQKIKAKLKDYNPVTGESSLRCNAKILTAVNNGKPVWNEEDLIKPHFISESPSVTHNDTVYTNVPFYDLLIQPTYSQEEGRVISVMPDEPNADRTEVNNVTFDLILDNGMAYTRTVEIDLNPNEQVTVYLHIRPEKVDYDKSSAEQWIQEDSADDFYGTNNQNGNILSKTGSSWQRAYRIGTPPFNDVVTDGSNYTEQYLTKEQFIEKLSSAYEGGACHGDYFILTSNLLLDQWTPIDFSGHLDGRNYTITLSDSDHLFTSLNGSYDANIGVANVHVSNGMISPIKGRRAEIMNLSIASALQGKSLVSGISSGYMFNCTVTAPGKLFDILDAQYGMTEYCKELPNQ